MPEHPEQERPPSGRRRAETEPDRGGVGAPGRVVTRTAHSGGAFDLLHPPSTERIDDCVHCGFCLPTCPTYALWGEEMDSPRGRIWLMKLGLEGEVGMDEVFVRHFDACLGCMACVTACPSGVRYEELIEATRAQIERRHPRSLADRLFRALVFAVFTQPARLRVAVLLGWGYQRLGLAGGLRRSGLVDRLPARLRALLALLPPVTLRQMWRRLPERTPARGAARARVGLLTGCVQSVLFAEVNDATCRALAAEGCDVLAPKGQGCCGALMVHAGRETDAVERAKRTIETFDAAGVDVVVVNAAGCGSTMKQYGHLLRDEPGWAQRAESFSAKVRDATEYLAEIEPRAERHPINARVAYHDACHLRHAQGIQRQPRQLLSGIPGLEVVALAEPDICCGSAGIYNLVEPQAAEDLGHRKARHISAAAPDAVATANPGCLLQLRRFLHDEHHARLPLLHPAQLVDASIRGLDPVSGPPARGRRPAGPAATRNPP